MTYDITTKTAPAMPKTWKRLGFCEISALAGISRHA